MHVVTAQVFVFFPQKRCQRHASRARVLGVLHNNARIALGSKQQKTHDSVSGQVLEKERVNLQNLASVDQQILRLVAKMLQNVQLVLSDTSAFTLAKHTQQAHVSAHDRSVSLAFFIMCAKGRKKDGEIENLALRPQSRGMSIKNCSSWGVISSKNALLSLKTSINVSAISGSKPSCAHAMSERSGEETRR